MAVRCVLAPRRATRECRIPVRSTGPFYRCRNGCGGRDTSSFAQLSPVHRGKGGLTAMIIYGDYGSSSTRRVLTVLRHLEVEFEFRLVNLSAGENKRPEYLAINPNGAVPAMLDGRVILFEASAIMLYIAAQHPSPLLPDGDAYFDTIKWMFWAAEHFRRGHTDLIEERYLKRAHQLQADDRICARAEASVHRYAAVLNEHLSNRRFVVGDSPTLADIDLAAPLSHLRRTAAPYNKYPHIASWHDRLLSEMPEWRETGELLERRISEIEARSRAPTGARSGEHALQAQ
jgi:glutathione S-transferase